MALLPELHSTNLGQGGFNIEVHQTTLASGTITVSTKMNNPKCCLIGAYHATPTATSEENFRYSIADRTITINALVGAAATTTIRVIVFGYGA